jgi:hypothetical protein
LPSNQEHRREDRRSAERFKLFCDLEYSILGLSRAEVGSGKTINMSSSGLLVLTDRLLSPGLKVELQVYWPAKLEGRSRLKLVVFGEVVRVQTEQATQAGVKVDRYEFRAIAA